MSSTRCAKGLQLHQFMILRAWIAERGDATGRASGSSIGMWRNGPSAYVGGAL